MKGDEPEDIDVFLDTLLAKYFTGEPRPGLESRILAKLQSRSVRSRRAYWAASFAAVSLVAIGVLSLWLPVRRSAEPVRSDAAASMQKGAGLAATPSVLSRSRHVANARRTKTIAPEIRQVQFPSPEPLSAEERLLILYAQQLQAQNAPFTAMQLGRPVSKLEIKELKIPRLPVGE